MNPPSPTLSALSTSTTRSIKCCTIFKHTPLDQNKASIRLLKITSDLSPDGLIQCAVTHTTIEQASYACLSYMWGLPLPSHDILIDGRRYSVGQNLFDFLDVLRKRPDTLELWIDAICIAQGNISERNHQVTQMGQIYSTAQVVYVWLGRQPSIAHVVRSVKNWQNPTYEDLGSVRSAVFKQYLYNNEYWNRAWITQEFILARHIIIFLDDEALDMMTLSSALRSFYLLADKDAKSSVFNRHVSSKYMNPEVTMGQPLISLLSRFRDKNCSIPRDRIFSLLSLCSPSSRIKVNYEQRSIDLLKSILARHKDSLCLCDITLILRSLDLGGIPHASQNSENESRQELDLMYIEIYMLGIQIKHIPQYGWANDSLYDCLYLYGGSICPVVQEVIAHAARNAVQPRSGLQHAQNPAEGTHHKTPLFPYQKLSEKYAGMLALTRAEDLAVITSEYDPRAYAFRLPLSSVARMPLQSRPVCPVAERCTTWIYASPDTKSYSYFGTHSFTNAWNQWHEKLSIVGSSFKLPRDMPMQVCNDAYRILLQSGDVPADMMMWRQDSAYYRFLNELRQYRLGLLTRIPAVKLADAVARGIAMGWTCGWGPCRLVVQPQTR